MKIRMIEAVVALAAVAVCGCDMIKKDASSGNERAGRAYRLAMANFAAGRLDEAINGLEQVLVDDPGNASARFQLACIQHESGSDYLNAVCNYGEYLRFSPRGDKADVARQRRKLCMQMLAADLATRCGATNKIPATVQEKLSAAESNAALMTRKVADLERNIASLTAENSRLRRLVGSVGTDDDLSDPDGAVLPVGDDESGSDAARLADEATALRDEGRDEADAVGTIDPVAPSTSGGMRASGEKKAAGEKNRREFVHEDKPEYYIVKEGDTLYQISLRFYGSTSNWRTIRDANKAVITPSGRLRVGQRLRLP